MMTLPVHETFFSFQGEGCHSGRAAFFIRLYGCPLHCPWCDSAGTWSANYKPTNLQKVDVDTLAKTAKVSGAQFVVITGGEPCIHDLTGLVAALKRVQIPVHLETCGAFPIPTGINWLTVSPKREKPPTLDALYEADEWKIIVDSPNAIGEWWDGTLGGVYARRDIVSPVVWLHPEWSKRDDPTIRQRIVAAVKGMPHLFRAGWQMHKLYAADQFDQRSAPQVPLGGNPKMGF